jgi:hypothetical protein
VFGSAEVDGEVLPEGSRISAQIDNDIESLPSNAPDQLHLGMGFMLEM